MRHRRLHHVRVRRVEARGQLSGGLDGRLDGAGHAQLPASSGVQLEHVLVPEVTYSEYGKEGPPSCRSVERVLVLVHGQSRDRRRRPLPPRQAEGLALGCAPRRPARLDAGRGDPPRRHRPGSGRPGGRRVCHPGRRAVQRHGAARLAACRPPPAHRSHSGRRPVRFGPAVRPPRPRHGRRGHDRRRHRVWRRVDVAHPPRQQRPARPRRPAPRRLGHRHAQPVRGSRPDREEAGVQPRAPRPVRPRLAAEGPDRRGRGTLQARDRAAQRSGPRCRGSADRRDPDVDADQGLRDTTLEGLAQLKSVLPTACTPLVRRRRSPTAPRRC